MHIDTSYKAYDLIRKHINQEVEEIWALALSSDLRLIAHDMIFRGTLNQCLFHPRDIFRFACKKNAACFILVHNHPSGDARPSRADQIMTKRLFTLSVVLEIPMKDHVIVTKNQHYSFSDNGKLSLSKTLSALYSQGPI